MSNLYGSGGRRNNGNMVFGANAIAEACKRNKSLDHAGRAQTSIADQPHTSEREIARRKRQAERRAKK